MEKDYRLTAVSCYCSYFVQAAVNNFFPLLFVYFNDSFGLSMMELSLLAFLNFLFQLAVDFSSSFFVSRIGYRKAGFIGHGCAVIGFVLFGILPRIMNPFAGLMISILFYAVGGGLIEVIISPIMEKISVSHKASSMGLLHGAYCFGAAGVILLSFVFFLLFGTANYQYMSFFLALIPLVCLFLFIKAPFPEIPVKTVVEKDGKHRVSPAVLTAFIGSICLSGAIELGIAQWSSTFAETGLNVKKPYGDLFGPFLFAVTQGFARVFYAWLSRRRPIRPLLFAGAAVSAGGYLLASLCPVPFFSFLGSILVALGVAPLWPGIMTLAGECFRDGNEKIYSFLALAGDIGCGLGTYAVGLLAGATSLATALLIGTAFPLLFLVFFFFIRKEKR